MADEYLFISDCHLHASRPEICEALTGFLDRRATRADRLYILGDLFEVWIGDDDRPEGINPVIESLQRVAQNCEIFFMVGNRDFLLGEDFAKKVGMTLLTEPERIELGQQALLLIHGDSLCSDDVDYQAFRKMVRDPKWQSEFLAKPLQQRQQIAARLRRDSAAAMAHKPVEIMDVNQQAVKQCFLDHQVDNIIHGHTHRPAVHRYANNLTRYVLGDWNPGPSVLSWSSSSGYKLEDARVKPGQAAR